MALAMCAKQGQWVAQVFRDLGRPQYIGKDRRVHMSGDNRGALALTENPQLQERSKHIDIAYHYIRDLIEKGKAFVEYIPTDCVQRVRFKDLMGVVIK